MGSDNRPRPFLESFRLIAWVLTASLVFALVNVLLLRMEIGHAFLLHAAAVSALTFLLFALDKWKADRGARRVSEGNLIALSFLGGGTGSLFAMGLLRHKTRKPLFMFLVPTFAIVHGVVAALLLWG